MKHYSLFITLVFILGTSFPLDANPYRPNPNQTAKTPKESKQEEKLQRKMDKRIEKEIRKQERKQKRAEKRLKRLKKKIAKWEKKKGKKRFFGGVSDTRNFRIGLILLLGGLAGVIVGSIINFGLLNWLGGFTALVGLGFIIWALIEYST
ncbi:MAG: hypothetical protein AAF985_10580 [Bacteroidota bacterium]